MRATIGRSIPEVACYYAKTKPVSLTDEQPLIMFILDIFTREPITRFRRLPVGFHKTHRLPWKPS